VLCHCWGVEHDVYLGTAAGEIYRFNQEDVYRIVFEDEDDMQYNETTEPPKAKPAVTALLMSRSYVIAAFSDGTLKWIPDSDDLPLITRSVTSVAVSSLEFQPGFKALCVTTATRSVLEIPLNSSLLPIDTSPRTVCEHHPLSVQ